jgi:predicted unusual protein kinase regulating ubiquinone biosynthesis (AarF/ABC1/UbiB family)
VEEAFEALMAHAGQPKTTQVGPGTLIRRSAHIASVMTRHGLSDFFGKEAEASGNTEAVRERARKFRDALQDLGPTFSKLGQILSTRPDLLPPAFIEELATLQQNVTPLTEEEVVGVIEEELGVPWEDAFESIDPTPMAAGTIAQVHRAVLEDGDRVVVKVQRPRAEEEISTDLELLKVFAEATEHRSDFRRMIDVPAIVEHLSEGLRRELDFRGEASNIERMGTILEPFSRLAVPKVYEMFTTPRLLVMEEIQGVAVKEAPQGEARKEAARQMLESYYRQVLSEGFFHADPHPGNMRWWNDKIYFLDFGMVGELDAGLRDALLLLVMALWQEDTQFAAEAILALASDNEGGVKEQFVNDLGVIMDKHRHLSLKEIELGPLLTELTAVAMKHDVRLPASLALTAKALAQMQLAAAELDPTLDPFAVAGQFMLRHILGKVRDRVAPGKLLYELSKVQTRMGRMFLALENLMGAAKGGRLQVQFRGTERLEDSIRSVGRRLALALGAVATMLGTAVASNGHSIPTWVSVGGVSLGSALLLGLVYDLLRPKKR